MDRHEIALLQQRVHRRIGGVHRTRRFRLLPGTSVEDAAAEAAQHACKCGPDATQPDDPHGTAVDVASGHPHRSPNRPCTALDRIRAFGQAARSGQKQGNCQLRGRFGEDTRRVPQDDAPFTQRGHVHMVVADRHSGDDPQPGSSRVQQLVVDRVRQQTVEAVCALHPFQQRAAFDRLLAVPVAGVATLQDRIQRGRRQLAGYDNCRLAHLFCGPLSCANRTGSYNLRAVASSIPVLPALLPPAPRTSPARG